MIAYILCGIIVIQSVMHRFERKDLYNRIMSRTLTEYKGERRTGIKTAHDRVLNRWRGKDGET
jgi:hypothetical protein